MSYLLNLKPYQGRPTTGLLTRFRETVRSRKPAGAGRTGDNI